jgi:uncharacterized protein (DUF1499 family)
MKLKQNILIARTGFALALVAGLAGIAAAFGTKWNFWNYHVGFSILRWAAYGGLFAAAVSLAEFMVIVVRRTRHNLVWAVLGLLIGVVVAAIPYQWLRRAESAAPIHEVSTDTVRPPAFEKIIPLREKAENPAEYGGSLAARAQIEAYPDIVPLLFSDPPGKVFDKALAVARSMGWRIIDADRARGHIEAVDETFWFGFKDDIVIRIEKSGFRTRLDIRSVSRVGKTDIGTNARRVRTFLQAMGKPVVSGS